MFRPFVPVSLATDDASTPELGGLIDTGADAILASDLLADELGLDLADNEGEELHAVGGRTVLARYKTVSLRLHHPTIPTPTARGKPRWDSSMAGTASALSCLSQLQMVASLTPKVAASWATLVPDRASSIT